MEELITLKASFRGGVADEHRIPAYYGSESVDGIARALTMVSFFVQEGKVRQRAPFDSQIRVYIEATKPGSLDFIFTFLSENLDLIALGVAVGKDAAKDILVDTIKTAFRRVAGKEHAPAQQSVKQLQRERSGDLEALIDAIEPAIKRGHTSIGQGVVNINLICGDNNVVTFNQDTKAYVEASITGDEEEILDVSCGAIDVNSRNGRAYLHDIGKTVPFKVHKDADASTLSAISYSVDRYANKLPSDITVRMRRIFSVDGRTKKLIIYGAWKIEI